MWYLTIRRECLRTNITEFHLVLWEANGELPDHLGTLVPNSELRLLRPQLG